MKSVSVDLQRRKAKYWLFIMGLFFSACMLMAGIANLVASGFSWSIGIFILFILLLVIGISMSLYDLFKKKNPKLTVESNGETIQFYFSHALGKSKESKKIKLADMKRFYLVKKRTRFLLTDLSFEFEPKSGIFKEEIDVFPELLDTDENGIRTILNFVGEVAPPDLKIGYGGSILSQLFKK